MTATLGERGTDDPAGWPPGRLGAVRKHELRASLAALDVTEHHLLGLADGALAAQPADAITRHLAQIIGVVEPDTIITFGPEGMTGHEDHQTVSAWATSAHALPRGVQYLPRRGPAAAHTRVRSRGVAAAGA
ncbi:MAG TPA: PIG-L family deacetylase [Streptosporangiaceae bacterium]|nr:PIG-L family deacetylase [Streptosporangiaceae bacterium]